MSIKVGTILTHAMARTAMTVNLFGWREDGVAETAKFLSLLIHGNDWKLLAITSKQSVLLCAPFKYQRPGMAEPVLELHDNGGEVDGQWVNRDDTHFSIASTHCDRPLNAETMHYRILTYLGGEPVDWQHVEEPWTDEEYRLICLCEHKKPSPPTICAYKPADELHPVLVPCITDETVPTANVGCRTGHADSTPARRHAHPSHDGRRCCQPLGVSGHAQRATVPSRPRLGH